MLEEPCPLCGFDGQLYTALDRETTQKIIPAMLQASAEGLSVEEMAVVGSTGTSIAELLATPHGEPGGGLHKGLHALALIGRQRVELGLGAAAQAGSVVQISVSSGGVPKLPIDAVVVGPTGLSGDSQNDRRHHGRPVQAVCLWSADVIAALAAEGHPIAAGNAGENLTLAGFDWASLRPGSRITVGPVPMMITAHAIPCAKNAQWFSDRDFKRILHERNPGLSRLYAVPLAAGEVAVGDPVTIEE